jgi:hypothetical protein
MSKEAAVRAMREARYRERAGTSTAASTPARPAVPQAKAQAASTATPDSPTEALCGHRSMNGRACTREQGHAAKSHRYS